MLLLLTGCLRHSAGKLYQEVPVRDHARAKRAWLRSPDGDPGP